MGVRYLGRLVRAAHSSTGLPVVVFMLIAALVCPATTWPAMNSAHPSSHGTSATTSVTLVREIRSWSNPTYTRVVIDIEGEVPYRAGRLQNPDRLYLDLLGAQLAPSLQGRPREGADQIVYGIRAAQNQRQVVRVVMDIGAIREYHVFTINNPYRVVIDIMGKISSSPAQGPIPASSPRSDARESSRSRVRDDSRATSQRGSVGRESRWHVIIDAGHGGKDPGAIGPSGLMEKDVVLDIAKRLRDLMRQEAQWHLTLTRDTDVFVPLEERTAIANAKSADLFISIHANAAERSDLYGIETYFLDLANDEQSMRVAARENATTLRKVGDLQLILRDLLMTSKRNESSLLAGSVQRALVQTPGTGKNGRDLGVKHAPFMVLIGAEMPAILIETGFISNSGEERKLADPKYRSQAAQAIFTGIKDYLVTTNGGLARQVQR